MAEPEQTNHQQQPKKALVTDSNHKVMSAWTKGCDTVATAVPRLKKIYCTQVMPKIDVIIEKFQSFQLKVEPKVDFVIMKAQSIPFSYEMIQQQSTILNLVHGVFLMMCGGSWVSFATLISFLSVYKVWDALMGLKAKVKDADMLSVNKCLHQLWLLTVVLYAVWTNPLLSKIMVAFMLEKHVSNTMINPSLKNLLEERFPIVDMFGRWWPFVLKAATRLVLVFLSIFFYNIQVCLVMACIGYQKVCMAISPALREQIQVMEGPFKLDGAALTQWACVIACTGWQLCHSYESSFLGIIVPVGFLVPAKKVKET